MLLRRIRGLLGVATFSAVAWTVTGVMIGAILQVLRPQEFEPGEGFGLLAFYFARGGFIAGLVGAVVLAIAERARSVRSLSAWRLALWGALGGLALPWLGAAPLAMLPALFVLGTATGVTLWSLGRRGAKLEIARSPADVRSLRTDAN